MSRQKLEQTGDKILRAFHDIDIDNENKHAVKHGFDMVRSKIFNFHSIISVHLESQREKEAKNRYI